MEQLLHYVWQHRLFPLGPLHTTDGQGLEIIDPGLHNLGAGPDFFNAKVRIGGQMWVGNVEVHQRSSDWFRHHHEHDSAYANVILHVVGTDDCPVTSPQPVPPVGTPLPHPTQAPHAEVEHSEATPATGRPIPALELAVPDSVMANYRELLAEEAYPPCYRVIPSLSPLLVHSWMSALTVERLETKTDRVEGWLERTRGDWERVFFITLARAFGFGTNADAFERWATSIDLTQVGRHRSSPLQVLAYFLGQAGFLSDGPRSDADEAQRACYERVAGEYRFMAHMFGLTPLPRAMWKTGRLRPQNAPMVRIAQLAELYGSFRLDLSAVREAADINALRQLLGATTCTGFEALTGGPYSLSEASVDLLIVNAIAPILFAYGRRHHDNTLTESAFALLEAIKPEHNAITRSWDRAGITSQHAADSQALIQLRSHYCDRKDCLHCRFGKAYLSREV